MSTDIGSQSIPEELEEELLSTSNVEATGIGLKETNNEVTDEEAVMVFVSEKFSEKELDHQDMDLIPGEVDIEDTTYKTDVIELGGKIRVQEMVTPDVETIPESEVDVAPAPAARTEPEVEAIPDSFSRKEKWRPAPAGVSVGHPEITAGTLGTPPLRTQANRTVFLTNAHVAAPIGEADVGDEIIQQGRYDGGQEGEDAIGALLEWSDISDTEVNTTDSALVEIDADVLQSDILGLWEDLHGWADSSFNTQHIKSGRTTGVTSGRLRARNVSANVNGYFPGQPARFKGLDLFTAMSAGGDSGSMIGIEQEDGFYGTALLFAGSSQVTLGIPMDVVQEEHGQLTPMTSQQLVDPNDLRVTGTHFTGTLDSNQTTYRWSGPWSDRYVVDFTVHPTTNKGWIEGSVHSTYRTSSGVWYLIQLKNRQESSTGFEVKYTVFR